MSNGRESSIRIQVLDRCLSNHAHRYHLIDLRLECTRKLIECGYTKYNIAEPFDENDESNVLVSRRSIFEDLNYLESTEGYCALIDRMPDEEDVRLDGKVLRRTYYRYRDKNFSINQRPLSPEEQNNLRELVTMLNRFEGVPQFNWMDGMITKLTDFFKLEGNTHNVIGLDNNSDLIGLKWISTLFESIVGKHTLNISYKRFGDTHVLKFIIHPYFLKEYNQRWFLLGLNNVNKVITILALDRIINVKDAPAISYIEQDEDIDFTNDYFYDVIGVTIERHPETHKPLPVEEVVLKFDERRYPYVVTKPMHPTQKNDDINHIITINVIPNRELITLLLSYGPQVEVLRPASLRAEIERNIAQMISIYNK